jgi:hypothetical protein
MTQYAGVLPPFRDEEAEVLDIIEAYFADPAHTRTVYTGNETPEGDDLQTSLPFIRVGRAGGNSSAIDDNPVTDIDVLARTRREAKDIAQELQQLMMSCPHPIDTCSVLMAPQKVEWQEGSPIRRFYASYHLSLRR